MDKRVHGTELGGLLRLLAHDLRNPLAALESNLHFLEGELGLADRNARESLEDSKLSCDGLARVIESVEVLGRLLEGRIEEPRGPAPLAVLAASALAASAPAARSHRVELAVRPLGSDAEPDVVVGREMFVRAARAVLHNAIQHAPCGSEVQVSRVDLGDRIALRIGDAGPCLSPELRVEAFSAAGQLKAKGRPGGRYSGGLGLFCAGICAEAAGAVLEAVPGAAGNVFELRMRRA